MEFRNESCQLSKSPIQKGDSIVLFLMIPNVEHKKHRILGTGLYNVETDFNVISLPVFGKYNGHGGIESIEETPVWSKIQQKLANCHINLNDVISNNSLTMDEIELTVYPAFFHRDEWDKFLTIKKANYTIVEDAKNSIYRKMILDMEPSVNLEDIIKSSTNVNDVKKQMELIDTLPSVVRKELMLWVEFEDELKSFLHVLTIMNEKGKKLRKMKKRLDR